MQEIMKSSESGFNWTSRDIADWTGKLHFNVMQDIRDEISKLKRAGMDEYLKLCFLYKENSGKSPIRNNYYKLSQLGVLQIAARYSTVIRAKIIMKIVSIENDLIEDKIYKCINGGYYGKYS